MLRRYAVVSTLFFSASFLTVSGNAMAKDFPKDTIRVTIPFAPGGGTDFLTRTVISKMSERTGWPMIVENKPGAAGAIAMNYVNRAKADGYELVLGQLDTVAIAPAIYTDSISWDPIKDFEPIGLMATTPLLIVSSSKGEFDTLPKALEAAKANPGKIDYASPGVGSVSHLAVAMVEQEAGVEMQHVPYKGAGPAMTDLLGQRVQLYAASIAAAMPQIQAGLVTPLAVTGSTRSHALPDTPTVAELGYPSVDIDLWYGLFAPAGVAPQRIEKIRAALNETLADEEVVKLLAEQGLNVKPSEPQVLADLVEIDVKRWPSIVDKAGVKN